MEGRWDSIMCRYLFGIGLIQGDYPIICVNLLRVVE